MDHSHPRWAANGSVRRLLPLLNVFLFSPELPVLSGVKAAAEVLCLTPLIGLWGPCRGPKVVDVQPIDLKISGSKVNSLSQGKQTFSGRERGEQTS